MFRSFANQVPRVSQAVATSSPGGLRQLSATSRLEENRPLNRRLEVDLQELTNLQYLDKVTLIDVRQPAEHSAQQNIPGSLHIPLGNLRDAFSLSPEAWTSRYNTPKPSKGDKAIIFYARGPIASSAAVEIAHKMGYRKSRHYAGGMQDYCSRNNLPLKVVTVPQQPHMSTQGEEQSIQQHYNYHYYNPDLHYL